MFFELIQILLVRKSWWILALVRKTELVETMGLT